TENPWPSLGLRGQHASSSEASIRLIKFAAAALAAEAHGAGDLGERQSLGAGGPAPEREAGTHRQSRKQVYSYSNKPTNCTRRRRKCFAGG
ncbi:mCG146022, partial [Mus musculus]